MQQNKQSWTLAFNYLFLATVSLCICFQVEASDQVASQLQRGADIRPEAGHCDIGPFGKSGPVGDYEGSCSKLSVSEKCLAFLKLHITEDGHLEPAYDSAKAQFCISSLGSRLVK